MLHRNADGCGGGRHAAIIMEKGLVQVSDKGMLLQVINKVIVDNQKNLELYLVGKTELLDFFVRQMMKATSGKANPGVVSELLRERLKG